MTRAQFELTMKRMGGELFWLSVDGDSVMLSSDKSSGHHVLRKCPTESAARRARSRYQRWLP